MDVDVDRRRTRCIADHRGLDCHWTSAGRCRVGAVRDSVRMANAALLCARVDLPRRLSQCRFPDADGCRSNWRTRGMAGAAVCRSTDSDLAAAYAVWFDRYDLPGWRAGAGNWLSATNAADAGARPE